jgi:hypothetical protein
VTFDLLPLRLHLAARQRLHFAPGAAGNLLRGAFGAALKRVACVPECRDARVCPRRASCAYARLFEPAAAVGTGPSGLADWPRPFVFRVRHLDGATVLSGGAFHVDVHLFETRTPLAPEFLRVFEGMLHSTLASVEPSPEPLRLPLEASAEPVHRLRVEFLTPTQLKAEGGLAARPEFPILFGRARDRVATLRALYGAGALEIDFAGLGRRAAGVRMTNCEIASVAAGRRSARTGQTHSLGGFTGRAEYEGDLAEFLPYLRAAAFTGVGRHTVWGNGEIRVSILS